MSYYNSQYIPTDIIVVEREHGNSTDSNYDPMMGLTTGDFIIYLAIGLAYVILMSLVVDQLLEIELVDKACSFDNIGQMSVNQSTDKVLAKYGTCKTVKNTFDSKKFVYMIIIGAISVFAGGYLARSDPKYLTGGMGIALGGFWAIIYYTIYNWHSINRYIQLAIMGLLFAALVVGSIRM